MATRITEDCVNCNLCVAECPNGAIAPGEGLYVIDPARCTECVGFADEELCQSVCPAMCCVPDPLRPESEQALFERAERLHPGVTLILSARTSRFRRG